MKNKKILVVIFCFVAAVFLPLVSHAQTNNDILAKI